MVPALNTRLGKRFCLNFGILKNSRKYFFGNHTIGIDLCRMLISNGMISLRSLINKHVNEIEVDLNISLRFDNDSEVAYQSAPILLQFQILKEIVGGNDMLKMCLNRIPLRTYVVQKMDFYANMLLFFVHYEKTVNVRGNIPMSFNNKDFYLVSKDRIKDTINEMMVYESSDILNNPVQYNYTTREFQMLLSEFIDLLKRVEN